MIKVETHCHSRGGSHCGTASPRQIIKEYKEHGYGMIILTNHYCKVCYDEYPGLTHKQKLDHYFSLYEKLKREGEKHGIKVIYGAETRAVTDDGTYSEFMLYGFDRGLLYDNKPLFLLNQKEMFEFCEKHQIFMYQTHPYREGVAVRDARFMHGVEVFNGHVGHDNDNEKAYEFAKENNLKMMSGSDYHDYKQLIYGGLYLPDDITDQFKLRDYLFSNQPELITNQQLYLKNLKVKR